MPSQRPSRPPASHVAVAFLIVAVITFFAFWPSLAGEFVAWDDDQNFLANPHFRGLAAENLRWMWTTFHLGTWIPLSWMTLGLNYLQFGLEPAGYHATNMLLHALNAGLLFLVGLRVLARPTDSARAHAAQRSPMALVVAAGVGALVFALHPLRVESVSWITERRDVLSGCFYLATVLAFLRYAEGTGHASRWYVAAVGFHLLALLSKGTAVTVPGVLGLLWVYPLRQLDGAAGWGRAAWWRAVRVLLPFAALSVGFTIIVFTALQRIEQLPVAGKLAVSSYSWCFYLLKTLWPSGLAPLYTMPDVVTPTAPRYLVSYLVLVSAAIGCWVLRRRLPGAVMALVMFTAVVFPLLGVHQGGPQITADRNTYNASFALAIMAGGAVLLAWHRQRAVTVAASLLVLTTLAWCTWLQTQVWHDSERLWARVLEVEPDSPYGHNNYGNVLMRQGRVDDARSHYARAVELRPQYSQALANLGVTLAAAGQFDNAIDLYRRAIAIDSTRYDAESNWGIALMQRGALDSAITHFERALQINPDNADAHVNWGNALIRAGRPADAVPHYARAVALQPAHADAELNWGVALAVSGLMPEAAEHFRRALALQPTSAAAREYLAQAEAAMRGAPTTPGMR